MKVRVVVEFELPSAWQVGKETLGEAVIDFLENECLGDHRSLHVVAAEELKEVVK